MSENLVEVPRWGLPTDTAHVRIESRQYRIFRFDLGEGIARWKAAVALVIVIPYWAVLFLAGVSPLTGHGRGGVLFIFPAVLMVWAALRPDPGGRPQYALWLDRARYLTRRSQPMIDSPVARTGPGAAFLVTAEWTVLDPARLRPRPSGDRRHGDTRSAAQSPSNHAKARSRTSVAAFRAERKVTGSCPVYLG